MGALGWSIVSHAFWTSTSWIAFRDILRVVDLSPIVETSLCKSLSVSSYPTVAPVFVPDGRHTIRLACENYIVMSGHCPFEFPCL